MKKRVSFMLLTVVVLACIILVWGDKNAEGLKADYDAEMIIEYSLFRESIGNLTPYFEEMVEKPELKYDTTWNKDLHEALDNIKRSADGLIIKNPPSERKEQQKIAENVQRYATQFVETYKESIYTADDHLEDKAVEYLYFVQDEVNLLDKQMRRDWDK